jgi:LAS superfamily LD-carboxypeptidase LdcB
MLKSVYMQKQAKILAGLLIIVVLSLGSMLIYGHTLLTEVRAQKASLEEELKNTKATLATKETEALNLGQTLNEIRQEYALTKEDGAELLEMLTEERGRNEEFEEQIDGITGTVGKLDKLSKTDPELLQKYSKVYFLNEHYIPEKVVEIAKEFRFKTEEPEYIHAKVAHKLDDLLNDAKEDGVEILVSSAYRSFDEQKSIKNTYTTIYGSGANTFSADQGYSEHQLGTTVDFTTTAIGGGLTGFENSTAYTWLQKNAHRYGFVLSYPKDNAYYIFEPWHWRYVGEDLADDLHDDGKFFYDLEQREIDKYLISIFD